MAYKDKEKQKEYDRQWYLKNKERKAEYQRKNKEHRNSYLKEYRKTYRFDGHYSVYLLPKENYVGQTKCVRARMYQHKQDGNDTSDYKILHTFSTKEEALAKEKEYHEAGYNG